MMEADIFDKLFILEMANNHMGDLQHGLRIINEFHKVTKKFSFKFAVKFQYRELDSYIHPDCRNRSDLKYVKRFSDTRLKESDFAAMKAEMDRLGFISACTPFDEKSVDLIEKQKFDILKIASCSFTDWPLLERIAATKLPLVASTAGATLEEIDNVTAFLEHRQKTFCLMHCVGSYPTPDEELELNQIDLFRKRYPGIAVGFSTHESPDNFDPVKLAVAKGATVFERHIGVETEQYKLNAYSSDPENTEKWIEAADAAYRLCGVSGRRRNISDKEKADLRGLRRGVFCSKSIAAGETLNKENIFFAIPNQDTQLLANDISKYKTYTVRNDLPAMAALLESNLSTHDARQDVLEIVKSLCTLIRKSGIVLQDKLELELSHHYGIKNFRKCGCAIINCINREYCKKIILLLPEQSHPSHSHKLKEETFHILYGDVRINLDGEEKTYKAGDMLVIERNCKHSFSSEKGAVFEEISTTHYKNDSYYEEESISNNPNRKTVMTFRADWLEKEIM